MNFNKISRIVICLVLVCCLLVNASPIKANASTLTTAALWVSATVVVAAALQAVGVMSAPDSTTFDEVVNNCVAWLSETTSYVVDGMIQVVGLASGDLETWQSFLSTTFLETVLWWSFDSGTVLHPFTTHDAGSSFTAYDGSVFTCAQPFATFRYNYYYGNSHYMVDAVLVLDAKNVYVYKNGSTASSRTNFPTYGYLNWARTEKNYEDYPYGGICLGTIAQQKPLDIPQTAFYLLLTQYYGGTLDTYLPYSDGLTLGLIEAPDVGFQIGDADAYLNYAQSMIYAPGYGYADPEQEEDQLAYLPVSIPSQKYEDVQLQTQEQAQLGQTQLQFQEQEQTQTTTQGLLQNILQTVIQIPSQLLNGLTQILTDVLTFLFVPGQTFIQDHVQALQAKYTFLKPIESTFTDLKLFFQTMGTTPPIIYIDLGAATGWYPMGGKVKFIDLTWFAQYKSTSDFIIGSFLWLWFAWRMLHAIPGIIQGTSGMWGHFDAVPDFTFRPTPTSLPGGDDPKLLGASSPLPSGEKKRLGTSRYSGSRSKREYFKHHGG